MSVTSVLMSDTDTNTDTDTPFYTISTKLNYLSKQGLSYNSMKDVKYDKELTKILELNSLQFELEFFHLTNSFEASIQ